MAENIKSTQRRFEVMGEDIFKIVNKLLGDQTLLKLIKVLGTDICDDYLKFILYQAENVKKYDKR